MKLDQATAAGCAFTLVASVAAAPFPERRAPAIVDRSAEPSNNGAGIVAKDADPLPEPRTPTVITVSRDVVTRTNELEA